MTGIKTNENNGAIPPMRARIKRRGFTLLELMVSTAIIAIIAAIVVVSISGINAKKRDAARVSRLNSLNKALNIYYNGALKYPEYEGEINGSDPVSEKLLDAGAISGIAVDPLNSPPYVFNYSSDGTSFTITFCLETNSIKEYRKGCGNKISP